MARLMGFALCLILPSHVATTGIESWEDDSAMLQIDNAMASMQMESFGKSVRSLLASAQNATQKHNNSLAYNTEYYLSTVQPQMENATNFIVDKLATLSLTKKSKKKSSSCPLCWITAIIDGVTILYETESLPLPLEQKCSPIVLAVWWVMGLLTMTIDQGLTVPEALDMLAQQFTSVGYGSSTQNTTALKIFHGLHGVVSQMSVNRLMNELVDNSLASLEKMWAEKMGTAPDIVSAMINLAVVGSVLTFVFALDLGDGKKIGND